MNWFRKDTARYRFAPKYEKMSFAAVDEETNEGVKAKLAAAPVRLEAGLNRRFRFRQQLLHDLALVTLPDGAQGTINALLSDKKARPATLRVLKALTTREHSVRVKPDGLIVTTLISCPRLLKPHLLLAGEPVALCDISSAHWMFLPRLINERLAYRQRRGDDAPGMKSMQDEMEELIAICSSGSFYSQMCREGATPEDIKKRKKLLNVLLNSPQSKTASNVLWRGLKRRFPNCVSIIEVLKRRDHRAISRQLQHFTSAAISTALLDVQAQGIHAIPDTDCLIVRQRDHAAACRSIGKAMHKETRGVLVKVGGVHYEP